MSKYFVRTSDIQFDDYCIGHDIKFQFLSQDWVSGICNFLYEVEMDEQEVVRLKLASLEHKIMPGEKYYEPLQ
jgi:hypothetical protein